MTRTLARLLFTFAAIAFVVVARRTLLPEVERHLRPGVQLAASGLRSLSLLGLGLTPFLAAFGFAGLGALGLVGKARVIRKRRIIATIAFLVLVGIQTLFILGWARSTYELADRASLVAGESALGALGYAFLAVLVTRFGVGNGPLLLLTADIASQIDWLSSPILWLPLALVPAFARALSVTRPLSLRKSDGGDAPPFELPVVLAGIAPLSMATAMVVLPGALFAAIGIELLPSAATPWIMLAVECGLAVFFSYFVMALSLNPVLHANRLKEAGLTLEGAAPGKETAQVLEATQNRLVLPNAFVLVGLLVAPAFVELATGKATGTVWYLAPFLAAAVNDLWRETRARASGLDHALGEARDPVTALRAVALLRAAGIEAATTSLSARLLVWAFGLYAPVHVLVHDVDADRAREVLGPEGVLLA